MSLPTPSDPLPRHVIEFLHLTGFLWDHCALQHMLRDPAGDFNNVTPAILWANNKLGKILSFNAFIHFGSFTQIQCGLISNYSPLTEYLYLLNSCTFNSIGSISSSNFPISLILIWILHHIIVISLFFRSLCGTHWLKTTQDN